MSAAAPLPPGVSRIVNGREIRPYMDGVLVVFRVDGLDFRTVEDAARAAAAMPRELDD